MRAMEQIGLLVRNLHIGDTEAGRFEEVLPRPTLHTNTTWRRVGGSKVGAWSVVDASGRGKRACVWQT